MENIKYGFVYIWYDRKHKRYYIGSHWGTIDDNYICSSVWMNKSYKKRPHDFKRRILKYTSNQNDLLDKEYHYLSMIKQSELGIRYYNLRNYRFNHWTTNENASEIKRKLKKENRTPAQIEASRLHSINLKGQIPPNRISTKVFENEYSSKKAACKELGIAYSQLIFYEKNTHLNITNVEDLKRIIWEQRSIKLSNRYR